MMQIESPVYLCGQMTGLPEFNYPEFNRVAALLREKGYEVVTPSEQPPQPSWEDYMKSSIAMMMGCKTLLFMDNAHKSKGAMIEIRLARDIGMPVVGVNMVLECAR